MKSPGKILPPHLDPIQRDLLVVFTVALAVAAAIISVGFVLFH
jgi:hypothetical protein